MRFSISRRLDALEEQAGNGLAPDWTPEEMREKVLDELDFALSTDSPVYLCRDELVLLGVDSVSGLPEKLQRLVDLRPHTWGEIKHRYKEPPQRPFENWREKVSKQNERVRVFVEETKQCDRELLENNRASVGLPPLTAEQVEKWDLEDTIWAGGGS